MAQYLALISMVHESGLVALLHVSAVVGAFTAAYVGFDHSRGGRAPNEDAYRGTEEIARKLVLQLGLNSETSKTAMSSKKWGKMSIIYPTKVICVVGTMPLKMGLVHGTCHIAYRQIHIPFFGYFRYRIDYFVSGIIAIASITIFFLAAYALIWDDYFLSQSFLKNAFLFLVGSTAWLIVQGILSLLATHSRITKKCSRLDGIVKDRLLKRLAEAEATVREFKEDGGSNGGDDAPKA